MSIFSAESRLRRNQVRTLVMLLLGYAGYYFCRANLEVVKPLLLSEGALGVNLSVLGALSSAGIAAYAVGKALGGAITDFTGGRSLFVLGMCGSVFATAWFALSLSPEAFYLSWSANMLFQSMGWGALVKIAANWFPHRRYGRVMGLLSLSFLFGDSLARYYLGYLINVGYGWRGIMFVSAAALAAVAAASWLLVRSQPKPDYASRLAVNPANLFGAAGAHFRPPNLAQLLGPLFRRASFWLILLMSFGMTLVRKFFDMWSSTFISALTEVSPGDAAQYSALPPLVGGFSALAFGYVTDWSPGRQRGPVLVITQSALFVVLLGGPLLLDLSSLPGLLSFMAVVSALLIGPYTYLAGALALDLGARRGAATTANYTDFFGYLGGFVAGTGAGELAQAYDWQTTFGFLAAVTFLSAASAALFWQRHERPALRRQRRAAEAAESQEEELTPPGDSSD